MLLCLLTYLRKKVPVQTHSTRQQYFSSDSTFFLLLLGLEWSAALARTEAELDIGYTALLFSYTPGRASESRSPLKAKQEQKK